MKKYTDAHLETIDQTWIDAVEKMIENGPDEYGQYRCPPGQNDLIIKRGYCVTCHTAFGYYDPDYYCPCDHFGGCKNAIKEALNLIRQWKAWAGVEDER